MRNFLYTYLTLFLPLIGFAQEPYVELILAPASAVVGEPVQLVVKTNLHGDINIDYPTSFVEGYSLMNGMEQEYDAQTGKMITLSYHSRDGQFKAAGNFVIGPAYVRKGNKVYKSNVIKVKVSPAGTQHSTLDQKLLRKPTGGTIEVSKKSIYPGEPLIIEAKVYSKFAPTHYDAYQTYSVKPTAEQHSIGGPKRVHLKEEKVGHHRCYSFKHDKQVSFISQPGTINIAPFEMTLQSGFDSYPLTSRSQTVEVKPFPKNKPKNFSGTVGSYKVKSFFDNKKPVQGEIRSYILVIAGAGNLHQLEIPKLKLPDHISVYGDPEIEEKFSFTENGAEGQISYTFHLQLNQSGETFIPGYELSYFHVSSNEFVQLSGESYKFNIEINPNQQIANNTKVQSEDLVKNFKEYDKEANISASNTTKIIKWVGIGTPICLAFLFLLFRKKKGEESPEEIEVSLSEKFDFESKLVLLTRAKTDENQASFYKVLHGQLHQLISLIIKKEPGYILSHEEIKNGLFENNTNPIDVDQTLVLLTKCESMQFGLNVDQNEIEKDYSESQKLIQTLLVS